MSIRRSNYISQKKIDFGGLLISFAILFIALPLIELSDSASILMKTSISLTIFFSVYVIAERRLHFFIAVFLALPGIIINWIPLLEANFTAQILQLVFSAVLFAYVASLLLKNIFHTRLVDMNILYEATCVYLLLGVVWASIFTLLELTSPGSFFGLSGMDPTLNYSEKVQMLFESLFFYSYITLTTLGYGNIYPANNVASALASAEAIVGQLYLTILVARLVGLHIAQRAIKDT